MALAGDRSPIVATRFPPCRTLVPSLVPFMEESRKCNKERENRRTIGGDRSGGNEEIEADAAFEARIAPLEFAAAIYGRKRPLKSSP